MDFFEKQQFDQQLYHTIDRMSERIERVRHSIRQVIYGQEEVIDLTLIALLSGGHVLLVGVPGLAKTQLVKRMGEALGLTEKRVQCTPDLMPSDIIGSEILQQDRSGQKGFQFIQGPVFCQLLMVDEINRASPRTQSALLQAMQEHSVSIAGQHYTLPQPFHVLATQNPLEHAGTYPLPEAQLDRFLLQINVPYPHYEAERQMVLATTGVEVMSVEQVMTAAELQKVQYFIRELPIGDQVVDAILSLVRYARPDNRNLSDVQHYLAWGPGPRASQALLMTTRARAFLHGRLAPSLEDILALAKPVLRHRMALHFNARTDGIKIDTVIERLCQYTLLEDSPVSQ